MATFDPSRYLVKPGAVTPLVRTATTPTFDPANYKPSTSLVTDTSSTSTAPTTFKPDPTSTEVTYGFGPGGAGLTAQQQKVSDSVQNAFSNSLAQRDRDLQRYQMPQLSSNVENEALQRAIATANLANQQTNPYGITSARGSGGAGGGGRGGGGGGSGGYALPRTSGTGLAPRAAGAPWYSYLAPAMQGIAAVAPWLLGSDTLDKIRKQGVFGWLRNPNGTVTPVDQNGYPMTDFGATSPWGPAAGSDAATYGLLPGPDNPVPYTPYITDMRDYYPAPTDVFATGLDPSYYNTPTYSDFVGPPADLSGASPFNWATPPDTSAFASSFFPGP